MVPVAPPVEGRRWLASRPLTPADVEGRVVVLAFWSFGCEASLRAVDGLHEIAAAWPDQVVPLAVHTPRFPYEDDERRLAQAILRHRIEVPVVHDPDYLTWNRYNPPGWPATAVIDRRGQVIGMAPGLGHTETIVESVATELSRPTGRRDRDRANRTDRADRGGRRTLLVDALPDRIDGGILDRLEAERTETTLWFPEAVAVSPGGVVAVADSGNDRLLVGGMDDDQRTFRPEVEITDVAQPTAIAIAGDDLLYAVERATGSVIQIDLAAGTVDVVADELEAPTALLVDHDGSLVVADAGQDQLIRIAGTGGDGVLMGPIAGRGSTGCRDGAADRAELAQPVAVGRTSAGIAFCDAASSNIRILTDDGDVRTVTGNEFFDWGLVDGPAHRARLQRPSGLTVADDGSILIADTGNDRIRVLADRRLRTLGLKGLNQPTGLAVLPSGHLLIADTGNHRLVVADPEGASAWPAAVYPPTMTSVWQDEPAVDPGL